MRDTRSSRPRAAISSFTAAMAAATLTLGLAGCGDDGELVTGTDPTSPPAVEPVEYPTAATELVVDADTTIAWHGDPGTRVTIGGDGTVYRQAPAPAPQGWAGASQAMASSSRAVASGAPAAAPPPPPPAGLTVAEITPAGMQRLFQRAGELGLIETPIPDYDSDLAPTDQGTATLTLAAEGATFEHRLYAPRGADEEYTEARARLARFLEEVADLEALVGDENISDPEPFVPERWTVREGYGEAASGEWPFTAKPSQGCIAPPNRGERDTVSGAYEDPDASSGSVVWIVEPALPWDGC